MPNARDIAMTLLSRNPGFIDNDKKKKWVDAIKNNDVQNGERIATDLLNTYGVKKEDVPKIAQNFFGQMFH